MATSESSFLLFALLLVGYLNTLVPGVQAGRQCSLQERPNLELMSVEGPGGKILLETSGVKRKEDCYSACCHAAGAGCTAASYAVRGSVSVCKLVKCDPFSSCVWKPSQLSMVARIRRIQNLTTGPEGVSIVLVPSENSPRKPVPKYSPKQEPRKPVAVTKNEKPQQSGSGNKRPANTNGKQIQNQNVQAYKRNSTNVGNKENGKSAGGENQKKDVANVDDRSRGMFDYLKDFLMGKDDKLNKDGNNKPAQTGQVKKTNEEFTMANDLKLNPDGSKVSAEDILSLEELAIRRKELEQKRLKQKQEEAAKQKEKEKQLAAEKEKQKLKSNTVSTTTQKIIDIKNNDDFNILGANNQPATTASSSVGKSSTNFINVENSQSQTINPTTSITTANPKPVTQALSKQALWEKQRQIRLQQLRQRQLLLKKQAEEARKKQKEQIAHFSVTTVLIGIGTVVFLALVVIAALWKNVWSDDVAHYRPLRNYDSKGDNDQRQMLLGSGQRVTLNSM